MSALKIKLWFNENNPDSVVFVSGFCTDLSRCLVRFGIQAAIDANPGSTGGKNHLVILSGDDCQLTSYMEKCNQLFRQQGTIILLTDPAGPDAAALTRNFPSLLFWDKIADTGELRLFRRDSHESQALYWDRITDIVSLLKSDNDQTGRNHVFISQVDINQSSERENLKRTFNEMGYSVLPDKALSNDLDECSRQISGALDKARMIIHIIPGTYVPWFNNQQISLAEHQCNISAGYLKNSQQLAPRILWIPSAYEISDEENKVFIEKIQRDHEQTTGTTVLKSSVEDLKKLARNLLLNKRDEAEEQKLVTDVYMIIDVNTNGHYDSLSMTLKRKNLKTEINYKGITYNQHLAALAAARMVVLFYSDDNEQWLRSKVNDILKSKGMDESRPFDKIVLVKGNNEINSQLTEGKFTHILEDVKKLPALLTENEFNR
jgi:hypothetical protein